MLLHFALYLLRTVFAVIGGLLVGAFYSVVALVIFLFGGSAPFEANHTTLSQLVLAYLGGFGAAGVVIGLLLPLGRWRIGAAIIGLIAAVPAFGLIVVSIFGWPLNTNAILTVSTMSIALGPAMGIYLWHENQEFEKRIPTL